MIYTNKALKVKAKEMSFGKLHGVSVGEEGRGRREVFLPTPKGVEGEITEMRKDLSVGLSSTGRPRISADDGNLYIILSSERNYTRRGNGYIMVPVGQDVELIARGNGADGDAGRIGTWDAVVVRAHEGNVFRVVWGGSGYGYEPTFYVVYGGEVFSADQPQVEDLYDSLSGIGMTFSLRFKENQFSIYDEEWERI